MSRSFFSPCPCRRPAEASEAPQKQDPCFFNTQFSFGDIRYPQPSAAKSAAAPGGVGSEETRFCKRKHTLSHTMSDLLRHPPTWIPLCLMLQGHFSALAGARDTARGTGKRGKGKASDWGLQDRHTGVFGSVATIGPSGSSLFAGSPCVFPNLSLGLTYSIPPLMITRTCLGNSFADVRHVLTSAARTRKNKTNRRGCLAYALEKETCTCSKLPFPQVWGLWMINKPPNSNPAFVFASAVKGEKRRSFMTGLDATGVVLL